MVGNFIDKISRGKSQEKGSSTTDGKKDDKTSKQAEIDNSPPTTSSLLLDNITKPNVEAEESLKKPDEDHEGTDSKFIKTESQISIELFESVTDEDDKKWKSFNPHQTISEEISEISSKKDTLSHEEHAIQTIEKAKKMEKIMMGEKPKKSRLGFAKKIKTFEPYDFSIHGPLIEYTPPEGWKIVEEYWLYEPYNKIFIIYSEEEHDYRYIVVEPELTEYEKEVIIELKELVKNILENKEIIEVKLKEEILKESIDYLIHDIKIPLEVKSYYKVLYYIIRDFIFMGNVTPLMRDKKLEDISCNGYNLPIYVYHKDYANIETSVTFEPGELDSFIISLAQKCGKHISIAEPLLDATMPDGSRIQMTLGREVTDNGSTFTIRKFKEDPVTPIDLVAWETFSSEQMAYLWLCIENKKNLIFAGGTASGKTTSTNAIALFIPRISKIVTIEDTRELILPHENWIPGITRDAVVGEEGAIDMYDLLKAALRQRPEYIIVGEVRGKEALTLFQAMTTGHTTYSTLHADTVDGVIHRLENPPINVPRPMIEALDIISIQSETFVGDRRVRRNIEIAEIVGLDPYTKMIRTSSVFTWDSVNDKHNLIGTSNALEEIKRSRGWSNQRLSEELNRRRQIIDFMVRQNIRDSKSVSNIIHTYHVKPEEILRRMDIK